MNKVLIITYYWPPSGGAGVQRWVKFAKYLPASGWDPVILTVDPEYAAYPVTDYSLTKDLPASVKVHATPATNYFSIYRKNKSNIPSAGFANNVDDSLKGKFFRFVRGNFFLPDPRRGWNRYAFKKAVELIKNEGIRHVITTSPPHSTQLIGLSIKKKFPAIRWIADLRDPWTDIYYYHQFYPTLLSKTIDRILEKRVLINADNIVTVGQSLRTLFASKAVGLEKKINVITNGFDESDFNGVDPTSPTKFTLTYVGTLADNYPIAGLLDALKRLAANDIDFLLRFVGSVSDNARNKLKMKLPDSSVEIIQYVSHTDAIKYMKSSSILILIIPEHSSSKSIITGKIFEYLASRRPILCLGPADGDAAEIIHNAEAGETYHYSESDKITNFLIENIAEPTQSSDNKIFNYSRRNLTNELSEILNS